MMTVADIELAAKTEGDKIPVVLLKSTNNSIPNEDLWSSYVVIIYSIFKDGPIRLNYFAIAIIQ
jgi:hypothetical protein